MAEEWTVCSGCGRELARSVTTCPYCHYNCLDSPTGPTNHSYNRTSAPPTPASATGAVLSLVALAAICWWFIGGGSAPHLTANRTATYRVTGTATSALVTYQNAQSGSVQKIVTIPWEESDTFRDGSFAYVCAQNQGASGTVTT